MEACQSEHRNKEAGNHLFQVQAQVLAALVDRQVLAERSAVEIVEPVGRDPPVGRNVDDAVNS